MNFLDAFLQEINLGADFYTGLVASVLLTPRFPASRHVIFLVTKRNSGDLLMVAKVPRLRDAGGSIEREARNLIAIQALRPEGFDTIPRILAFERFRGYPVLLETALNGHAISPSLIRGEADFYRRAVIEWLAELSTPTSAAEAWYKHIGERPLRYLEANLGAEEQPLLARLREAVRPLHAAHLPFVVEHGDLSHPNLIMLPSGKVGAVDWELSEVQGMVASDLFFFLSYIAFSLAKSNETGDFLGPFDAAFFGPDAWTGPYIGLYAARVGIPIGLLAPLFALSWTRYLSNLLVRLRVGGDGPADAATLARLRSDRYYAIWRHAVLNIDRFVFSAGESSNDSDAVRHVG